jgi:hypothetical protein
VEDFDREIYGRVPKNAPKVKWEIAETTTGKNGDVDIVTKRLVGVLDNSMDPDIEVKIALTLTTPANAKTPVPVIMQFGGGFGGLGGGRGAENNEILEADIKAHQISTIEKLAATCGRMSVSELTAQQDADVRRLTTAGPVTQSAEDIRAWVRGMLVMSIEVMAEHYEDRAWSSGTKGAILQGRLSVMREVLDLMPNRES